MQSLEIWMFKTLLDRISFFRVENKHFAQEVEGDGVCFWIKTGPTLFISLWQFSNVFSGQIISNECHIFMGRRAEYRNCSFDLIEVVVTWEKWCSSEEFGENAADGPDVQGVGVMRCVQDDFRGTVPSGNDVFSQSGRRLLISSSQTKITNFQVAVFVQ